MQSSRRDILRMMKRYRSGKATAAEREFIDRYYAHFDKTPQDFPGKKETEKEIEAFLAGYTSQRPRVIRLWPRIAAAAASILLIFSAGGYLLLKNKTVQPEAMLPATQGITLTIAGRTIPIAYHHKGQIAKNATQTDSLLTYDAINAAPEMQTLTNNSGHKITIQLTDGTEAILDVASTLNYPSAFTGRQRRVTLNGQAYFKVKHDNQHPFFVDYQGQTAEDIGTEFNIHAYAEESAATTLISGSISVGGKILQPGEQLIDGSIQKANITAVTAWLQDQMILHNEKLEDIMHDVARIYQVKVIWQDEQSKQLTFGGYVSRNTKLAVLLNFIRETERVDFKVEGKIIYVTKPTKKSS